MKYTFFIIAFCTFVLIQCTNNNNTHIISNGSIGSLTSKTPLNQIEGIFNNDSIVSVTTADKELGLLGDVEVYSKKGEKLLLLSPNNQNSADATINTIRVYDSRYKTNKGLSVESTFKDLKKNYEISGIQTSIDAVVIFLKDSDVFVTIDKKELPENLRYNTNLTIEASQIPKEATFKYFMIAWED